MIFTDDSVVESDRVEQVDPFDQAPETHELDGGSSGPLGKRSLFYVLRKTIREFRDDQGTDLAATLTYYAVLSVFPAILALLGLLGAIGQGERTVTKILDILRPLVSTGVYNNISTPLHQLATSEGASVTLVVGIVGALWSASAYVGAFSRAMNRIYEVDEGRPFWKLRPMMLLVTLVSIVLCAVALLILVVSGPVAQSVGDQIGLGNKVLQVWSIAKWPVLAVVVILIVALLYWATPNVKPAKFRWMTPGALVAILVWLAASVGFAFYVINFSSYNHTYGSVAGVVVALLWLWLTNNALLLGAELDAELQRARQLRVGLPAEERIQLPVRDSRGIDRAERRRAKDLESGRAIRESAVGAGDPSDRPFGRR